MLNNLFKRPIIIRMEQGDYNRHIATIKAEAKVLADMRVEASEAERDAARKYASEVEDECDIAVKKYNEANDIATRALTLLSAVDTARSGGKQLRQAREQLFADAMLAGLWGEEK
jgi:hypothetical protein